MNELAAPFNSSQQAISKHLAYLERASLIKKHKVGRQNICELNPASIRQVDNWVEKYRVFWEDALDRLDEFLIDTSPEKSESGRKRNAKAKR